MQMMQQFLYFTQEGYKLNEISDYYTYIIDNTCFP